MALPFMRILQSFVFANHGPSGLPGRRCVFTAQAARTVAATVIAALLVTSNAAIAGEVDDTAAQSAGGDWSSADVGEVPVSGGMEPNGRGLIVAEDNDEQKNMLFYWSPPGLPRPAATGPAERFVRPDGAPSDVQAAYHNVPVTALVEDCETVRLAVGSAWEDALAARALSAYLEPWRDRAAASETRRMIERGARLYERVKPIDDGIRSVRLARDSRRAERLEEDVAFWRNELARAAREVVNYARDASALRRRLAEALNAEAKRRGLRARTIEARPWTDPRREAWRQAGPAVGVRLPLEPIDRSYPRWWAENLSIDPAYTATKFHQGGSRFITPERPIGAWGHNSDGRGGYDWTRFNEMIRHAARRQVGLLLELPTLHGFQSAEQVAERREYEIGRGWWFTTHYAAPVPEALADDLDAVLVALDAEGSPYPWGGVQLLNPDVAERYGRYLKQMAANLKRQDLYDTIAAIHLQRGGKADLAIAVDYSRYTRRLWQAFMKDRYGEVDRLNDAAGTEFASFDDLRVPRRELPAAVRGDWREFMSKQRKRYSNGAWGRFLRRKYGSVEKAAEALGRDYHTPYGWRSPRDFPPVIGQDYLDFRRHWVDHYMSVKRELVRQAFPDKLVIFEQRQFGDHDTMGGAAEHKWGGFLGGRNDLAQWTHAGIGHRDQPFMIRTIGPVGFGTRPSDALESLFRDYLWLHFTMPGNLLRYNYDWVAHGYNDHQFGWHSVTNHWRTNQLVYALGTTVANTEPKPQRVGLLLPRTTFDVHVGRIYDSFLGWDWALHSAKLPYSRIDEQFVRRGGLKGLDLDVLILPNMAAMDEATAGRLRRWVADGGTLIASQMPGRLDEYGRALPQPRLTDLFGATVEGTVSEAVRQTPLTVTIPRGHFTGDWPETTDRQPPFAVLSPREAQTMAKYEGGRPAIVRRAHGDGQAVILGYPFGEEFVTAERTSIGFQRLYVVYAREPQLVARVEWLRDFIVDQLGYEPDYETAYAEVARWGPKYREAWNPSLSTPEGFSQDPEDYFFITTVGDPRGEPHEMEVAHETPDIALRLYPRYREGLDTEYLGLSTRDVHYMTERATVHMYLSQHRYHCRINDPDIQAIWDVDRDVPVGFARDARGVSFTVDLPSGHIMLLAISRTPEVELFEPASFPGRGRDEVTARAEALAGEVGEASPVTILTPGQVDPWLRELARPVEAPANPPRRRRRKTDRQVGEKETVVISYGDPANRQAAETLDRFLTRHYGLSTEITEQFAVVKGGPGPGSSVETNDWARPLIMVGHEWNNNDMALHLAYWPWRYRPHGRPYGPHVPFGATYAWPGPDRAVVSLSRRFALITPDGAQVRMKFSHNHRIRDVKPEYPLMRRKLYIAGTGRAAERAVDALIDVLEDAAVPPSGAIDAAR